MFRSRRSALIKRLSRHRIVCNNEATCSVESCDDLEPKSAVHNMLKRLKEVQLEALLMAVESKGAEEPSPCVLVPRGDLRVGRKAVAPHILCCQLWRWPDLRHHQELKRLHHLCSTDNDSLYICCNPYHWSRLYKPDSPPPPYICKHPQEFNYEDQDLSEPVSQETGGADQYESYQSHLSGCSDVQKPWCNIAYWELSTRVGRLFPVAQPSVNVFGDLPHGEGLCLGTLAQIRPADNHSVLHTRTKLGQGITLFKGLEEHEVWLYNRSPHPIFVNSPTLDPPNTRRLNTYRVPPGSAIKIFDYQRCEYNKRFQDPAVLLEGPFDPSAVRISFAKGWGSKYSRQFITSCPCWLEVAFLVNR